MATNINRVTLTGNLTADPELRHNNGGTPVARLRLAVNERTKHGGEWTERANFFDVIVWGAQGENTARYLEKGRPVAIDGRLRWREWATDNGNKRQTVEIVADTVQFLGSPKNNDNPAAAEEPVAAGPASDDSIPF